MKHWLIGSVLLLGLLAPAAAFWQSRDSNYNVSVSGGGGAYTGPGDVIAYTGGAYYGIRAYSAATRGQKLVNVCNSTGGTDVGCADMFSDASTGALVSATIAGITCPGANCTIKTYYDLTAGNNCTSASCDVSQTTVASRDTLGTTGCGVTTRGYCAVTTGSIYVSAHNYVSSTQPVFFSGAVSVANTGSNQVVVGAYSGIIELSFWFHSTQVITITTDDTATNLWGSTYTNGFNAVAGLSAAGTGASYDVLNNNTAVTGTLNNTATNSVLSIHGDGFSNNLASGSVFLEAGLAAGIAPTSATAQTQNANSKAFWGF